jgi:hypothetical protein
MKNLTLVVGLLLCMNAFADLISDVTVVIQNITLEGGRAEDIYDALSDIREAVCNDVGCRHVVASATCSRMTRPVQVDTCTLGFEGRNEKNEPVFQFTSVLGNHAENLMDSLRAVPVNEEIAGEAGFETIMSTAKRISCEKTGPWYWRSYKCTFEL